MFPYPLGVLTLLQGVYSLLWIVVLMDVLSPTFDLREATGWSGPQTVLFIFAVGMPMFAVGVAMHTLSRNLFRKMKDAWDMEILTSLGIKLRLAEGIAYRPSGGPSLEDIHAAEGFDRMRKAGEFLHAVSYVLQIRAPDVYRSIQVYRDQYQLARGFVLPSLLLALVLPFWEPVPNAQVGAFPLISLQLLFLGIFFAGVCMYAFKERSHRYAAARLRAFSTLQCEWRETPPEATSHPAAPR
jgi:hypothetical protein